MAQFVLTRLAHAVFLLLAIVVISFLLVQLAPGDPVTALIGEFAVPDGYIEEVRAKYGLDRSVWAQLMMYLGNLAQGDLGFSFVSRQPVLTLIVERAGATALLMGSAMAIAAVVGVTLGALAARKANRPLDGGLQVMAIAGYALPVFWIGQMLIILLAINLGWLPTGGIRDIRGSAEGLARVGELLTFLLLPAATLSLRYLSINMRITRVQLIGALKSDYVTAARARGLPERTVVVHHGLRNALIPVVTIIGYNLGNALSGSVLVESVFNWPGLGRLMFEAIAARDHPVILGVFIASGIAVICANLITDIVYAWLDPRIEY